MPNTTDTKTSPLTEWVAIEGMRRKWNFRYVLLYISLFLGLAFCWTTGRATPNFVVLTGFVMFTGVGCLQSLQNILMLLHLPEHIGTPENMMASLDTLPAWFKKRMGIAG